MFLLKKRSNLVDFRQHILNGFPAIVNLSLTHLRIFSTAIFLQIKNISQNGEGKIEIKNKKNIFLF